MSKPKTVNISTVWPRNGEDFALTYGRRPLRRRPGRPPAKRRTREERSALAYVESLWRQGHLPSRIAELLEARYGNPVPPSYVESWILATLGDPTEHTAPEGR